MTVSSTRTFPYSGMDSGLFETLIGEAHSSTGGSTADDLRYVLTGQSEEEWERLSKEERLSVWQSSRQRPGNACMVRKAATSRHNPHLVG